MKYPSPPAVPIEELSEKWEVDSVEDSVMQSTVIEELQPVMWIVIVIQSTKYYGPCIYNYNLELVTIFFKIQYSQTI